MNLLDCIIKEYWCHHDYYWYVVSDIRSLHLICTIYSLFLFLFYNYYVVAITSWWIKDYQSIGRPKVPIALKWKTKDERIRKIVTSRTCIYQIFISDHAKCSVNARPWKCAVTVNCTLCTVTIIALKLWNTSYTLESHNSFVRAIRGRCEWSSKVSNRWGAGSTCVVLRTSPAFFVFTSSIIDQGGRSLGSHPV